MKTSSFYAHAKFWGNLSVFSHRIAKKNAKTTYDNFYRNFWKFWTIHKHLNTIVEFAIKNWNK